MIKTVVEKVGRAKEAITFPVLLRSKAFPNLIVLAIEESKETLGNFVGLVVQTDANVPLDLNTVHDLGIYAYDIAHGVKITIQND